MIVDLADRLQGVKEYYFVKKLEQIREMLREGKDVINFGIGSPDMSPSENAVKALVHTSSTDGNHGYQPYKGIPELRQSIAKWYSSTYGVALSPDKEILPLMGSKEGILHITLAFVNSGDEVLVPDPGYPTYTSLSTLLGASIRKYNLREENNYYPDFEELESQDLSNVKMMWVNYPHMPTGTPASQEVFERLIEYGKKNNILICHDNPYSMVLNNGKAVSILSAPGAMDVAIEFNSLSKSHNMAGWRVGMMVGAEDYINAALRVKSNIDSGMFKGIQAAANEALLESEDWHNERNEVYAERREWVLKILDKLEFEYDTNQVGMFIWAKPKNDIDDIPGWLDSILEQKHIFFTPGMIFGKNGEDHIRVSLCVPVERMKQAYERL